MNKKFNLTLTFLGLLLLSTSCAPSKNTQDQRIESKKRMASAVLFEKQKKEAFQIADLISLDDKVSGHCGFMTTNMDLINLTQKGRIDLVYKVPKILMPSCENYISGILARNKNIKSFKISKTKGETLVPENIVLVISNM